MDPTSSRKLLQAPSISRENAVIFGGKKYSISLSCLMFKLHEFPANYRGNLSGFVFFLKIKFNDLLMLNCFLQLISAQIFALSREY